ncbi:MAG: 4Fe-4S binding protein [Pontiellaceae bacterium]|nr:4Fe-4S binding protein [Pontiellaceae bacterium]
MSKKTIWIWRTGFQVCGIILAALSLFNEQPWIMTVFFAASFVLGPIFCGWICPFGAFQDAMAAVARKVGVKRKKVPKRLHYLLMLLRYILLGLILWVSADFVFKLMMYDPRANLLNYMSGYPLPLAAIVVILVFLLISGFLYERPFCSYFCVEGAKHGIFSALRPITIVKNSETCINCGACNSVCPMNVDVENYGQVRSLQCIDCLSCVAACPIKGTLKLTLMPRKGTMSQVIIILVSLGALSGLAFFVHSSNSPENSPPIVASISSEDAPSEPKQSEPIEVENAAEYGNAAGIKDGVYEGTGEGFRGPMTVAVTVEGQLITKVEVTKTTDDKQWFDRANAGVIPLIVEKQAADVDGVTGATYSSLGIKRAVADALTKAGGTKVDTISEPVGGGVRRRGGR